MIEYIQLNGENFNEKSLDNFKRLQSVTQCWRMENGEYVLKPVCYTEEWNLRELRQMAQKIIGVVKLGGRAYGAVEGGNVIGFALVDGRLFGNAYKYADLAEFYVSAPFRRRGIGRKLFNLARRGARELGAEKLYISAHSASEVISAYRSYGCKLASEINSALAEKEPCDLQLECDLM